MTSTLQAPPKGYAEWLTEVKARVHAAQQRATLAVNTELLQLYWSIGRDYLDRQEQAGWGGKVLDRLAQDLRSEFPEMKGFSRTNLMYMRQFAENWPDAQIVQQLVGQLPWGHNVVLLSKLKDQELRRTYAQYAIQYRWSRSVLVMQIETGAHKRIGQAVTNFDKVLPAPQSDLARECLKDPYRFDSALAKRRPNGRSRPRWFNTSRTSCLSSVPALPLPNDGGLSAADLRQGCGR